MGTIDTQRRRGLAAGIVAAAIWGGMYVVSEVVLDVILPFSLQSLRLLLGSAALGLWLKARDEFPRPSRRQLVALLGAGALGCGLSLGLQFVGTLLSTAANAAVVTATTPAFVYLFAAPLLQERIGRRRWLALLLSTLGVVAVLDPSRAALTPARWQGNLILVGAALTWALYSVLARRLTQEMGALPFTFVALNGGLLVSIPMAIGELTSKAIGPVGLGAWAGVLYLGLVSTALAFYLWNLAFERLEAGTASLTFFAQPLVGASLGAALLGEQLTPMFLLGSALILAGIYLAARPGD